MWVVVTCPNCQGNVETDASRPAAMVRCLHCETYFRIQGSHYTTINVARNDYEHAVSNACESIHLDSSFFLG